MYNDLGKLKVNKKTYANQTKAGVAMFISEKVSQREII